jgi:uncharacterized protein
LKESERIFNQTVELIRARFKLNLDGIHGVSHWQRVREIGLYLADETGVDQQVIILFSALHDSCRENDFIDREHGEKAALLARELHKKGLLPIDNNRLELLTTACRYHSERDYRTDDITIQTCLNADRLDLYRLGEIPDDRFLFGDKAKSRETRDFVLKLLGR